MSGRQFIYQHVHVAHFSPSVQLRDMYRDSAQLHVITPKNCHDVIVVRDN